jgi:hypothetical protein
MASFNGRRDGASVERERTRAVLSQWEQAGGRGDYQATELSAGKPKVLFEGPYEPVPARLPNFDVSPDGQRFLMLKPADTGESGPTQINVVVNWFEELKRRVPTEKK